MARRESRLSVLFPGERQDVELFVSCTDLKSTDMFRGIHASVSLYIERNNKYEISDKTEVIKSDSNPNFKKSFNLEFFFAVKQKLKIVVMDTTSDGHEKPIGEVEMSLGQIMGNKQQKVIFDLKKDAAKGVPGTGKLTIRAERVVYTSDVTKLTVKARQIKIPRGIFVKPATDFAIRLSRHLGGAEYGTVYESEIRKGENPRWSEIKIRFQKLSNGDYDRNIKAQLVNYTSSKIGVVLGEGLFTVNSLLENERLDYEVELINAKGQKIGVLVVDNFDQIEKPHFLEYLQAGLQFNVMIGIDYTSSNKDPYCRDSLHTLINPNELNQYQKAMVGVCEILLNYDADKRVLMYGFGGIPNFPKFKSELTSHCFPLTGDIFDPWAENIDGIMNVYKNSFKSIQLASPSYLEPVIRQAMQIAKRNKEKKSFEYTILLILTDGKCHDMQDAINALIQSANLPLSIIIVGIGENDFKKMEILDGDNGLINFKGEQAVRDLVQFVPFGDYECNPDLLAKNVLAEVPAQVVSYMSSQKIKPQNIQAQPARNPFQAVTVEHTDDIASEENKEQDFYMTNSWADYSFQPFKALEFMKKENNSFISLKEKTSPLNCMLHTDYSTSLAKVSNDPGKDQDVSY